MIESGYELIAVFTAWLIGLCFVRVKTDRAALFSLIVSVLCGVCAYALRLIGEVAWIEPAEIGIFMLAALIARFILKIQWDEALLSWLLALGAFAILLVPRLMYETSGVGLNGLAPWLGLGCVALFVGMLLLLYKRFPEKD